MFGKGFENCWYGILRVPGLELSGDLRFRGPRVLRKLRHDCNGRPYVQARKAVNHESDGRVREGRVMLHRAVMSVVLGRQLSRDELVLPGISANTGENGPLPVSRPANSEMPAPKTGRADELGADRLAARLACSCGFG